MNCVQRVQAAINHLSADRIPKGELLVDKEFIKDFMQISSDSLMGKPEIEIEFYRRLGIDLVCVHKGNFLSNNNNSIITRHIKPFKKEGFFVFSVLNGAFQSVLNQMGFSNFFRGIIKNTDKIAREIQEFSNKITVLVKETVQEGASGIIIADDIAYNKGIYVSPAFIKKFLLPCWQEQVNAAKELNIPIFFHSDGNLNAIMTLIIEAGFQGLQCVEPSSGMDIKEIKQKYGRDLCLMGNINPGLLSDDNLNQVHDNFAELTNAVDELISVAAPGGGFIFGTCSGLYKGLSPVKVSYMYELVDKIGFYKE